MEENIALVVFTMQGERPFYHYCNDQDGPGKRYFCTENFRPLDGCDWLSNVAKDPTNNAGKVV